MGPVFPVRPQTNGAPTYWDGQALAPMNRVAYSPSGSLLTVTSGAAADVLLTLKGHGSQSGKLVRLLDGSDAELFSISSNAKVINVPSSVAIGTGQVAPTGANTIALGHSNSLTGSGANQYAFGQSNTINSTGSNCLTFGNGNSVSGGAQNCVVFGRSNTITGTHSAVTIVGDSNTASQFGVCIGAGCSIGTTNEGAFAIGNGVNVTGARSVGLGTLTTITGAGILGYCTPDRDATIQTQRFSSTNTVRPLAETVDSWATSTDASRKARRTDYVWDTARREVSRDETDGSRAYRIQQVHATAPDDAMLPVGSVCFYTDGSGDLVIKLKDSGGTVRTGTVDLS